MQVKPPQKCEAEDRETREQRLRDFIFSSLAHVDGGMDDVLVIARSPETIGPRVLLSLSAELTQRRIAARFLFVGAPAGASGATWQVAFAPGFVHELRLLRDCRYLDGHEQIVIGGRNVWFGDSMRRDPDKRDAFSSFVADNGSEGAKSRMTFERIWRAGETIYASSGASESVAPSSDGVPAETVAQGALESLGVWRPVNRH
jgi:hypothetical protein